MESTDRNCDSDTPLKLLRPSLWSRWTILSRDASHLMSYAVPSIMVAWGIVMTLISLVKSFEGLVMYVLCNPHGLFPPNCLHLTCTPSNSARIFLGLTEAGLFHGVTYYISLWYKRDEQSKHFAIFFSAATVAGAFGGILAFGIEKMEGVARLRGWAWIVCSLSYCFSGFDGGAQENAVFAGGSGYNHCGRYCVFHHVRRMFLLPCICAYAYVPFLDVWVVGDLLAVPWNRPIPFARGT